MTSWISLELASITFLSHFFLQCYFHYLIEYSLSFNNWNTGSAHSCNDNVVLQNLACWLKLMDLQFCEQNNHHHNPSKKPSVWAFRNIFSQKKFELSLPLTFHFFFPILSSHCTEFVWESKFQTVLHDMSWIFWKAIRNLETEALDRISRT